MNMNYEEFIEKIKMGVSEKIGNDSNVKVHKIIKNNDIELDALTIAEEHAEASPTIYLNAYYEDYYHGKRIESIVDEIIRLYESHRGTMDFDIGFFKDFENVKSRIAYKVVNADSNVRLLQDVPHIKKMDLAMVFYCIIENTQLGSATALIHNSHLEMWKVTIEDIYKIALENTPKLLNSEIKSMDEIIKEMIIDDLESNGKDVDLEQITSEEFYDEVMEERNGVGMYVLTNKNKINGASCMFYNNVLDDFANEKENDLYILPSSIHEVIIVPAIDSIDKDDLNTMVREVNAEAVELGEILSDHVYYYNREIKEISM